MKKRVLSILVVCALGGVLLAGCGSDSGTESSAASEESTTAESTTDETSSGVASIAAENGEIVIAYSVEPTSLDPAHNTSYGGYHTINNICDSLLTLDENGDVQDNIATMEQVDDVTYVYTLQDGILFSDGTEMTAEDVVFSIEHYLDPDTAADTASMLSNVETVEATGDNEVTITLYEAQPNFKYIMATPCGQIFSKAYYESVGADAFGTAEGGIMGSGPYQLESWEVGVEVVLTVNEYYWGETPDISKVTLTLMEDSSSILLAMQSGQVDMNVDPAASLYDDIEALDTFNFESVEGSGTYFLTFNTQREPYDDVNVRKAIAYALDAYQIMYSQFGDYVTEASPYYCGYNSLLENEELWVEHAEELETYEYDLEKAKEYMAQSDYPDGFDTTIFYWMNPEIDHNLCVLIQSMLAEININVEVIDNTPSDSIAYGYGYMKDEDGLRDYDLFLCTWSLGFPDYTQVLEPLLYTSTIEVGGNMAAYGTEEIDSLLDSIKVETDSVTRTELMLDVMDIVNEECVYVPLGYTEFTLALSTSYTFDNYSCWWFCQSWLKDVHLAD